MRIVLSGGGTGGHITPMLSVAAALKRLEPTAELIYIGQRSPLAQTLLANSGLRQIHIISGKWRRYHGLKWWQKFFDIKTLGPNLADAGKLLIGTIQSLWWLLRLRPKAVFVKGGFVGLPVGLAAWVLGIPLVIHESDVVAGLTNRLLSRLASRIATGFPVRYYPRWSHKPLVFTGQPLRRLGSATTHEAKLWFAVASAKPVLLVITGSGGARAINKLVLAKLPQLLERVEIIHISGARDYQWLKQSPRTKASGYHLHEFLGSELGLAYQAADLVLSRAGMNTIAEIGAFGLPAIIVPHPYSPGAHQLRNGEVLEQEEAAMVIKEADLSNQLLPVLDELLGAKAKRTWLVKNLKRLSRPSAAHDVAKLIVSLL